MEGLRRLLIDYDSTLNPGQGNQPLVPERAALLQRYLEAWKDAGLEIYVLTASNPEKKVQALEAAGIRRLFHDVLSSNFPKKFQTKGDYIANRMRVDGWVPGEQLLADDSIEAIQSIWQNSEGEPHAQPLAHTLRLPQHSLQGLSEEDLQLIGARANATVGNSTWHAYSFHHGGRRVVDCCDSVAKCMLDSLPEESRAQVIRSNPPERQREWCDGRPDLEAHCVDVAVAGVDVQESRPDRSMQSSALPGLAPSGSKPWHARTSAPGKTQGKSSHALGKGRGKSSKSAKLPQTTQALVIDLVPFDHLVSKLEAAAAILSRDMSANGAQHSNQTEIATSTAATPDSNNSPIIIDLAGFDALVTRLEAAADRVERKAAESVNSKCKVGRN